MSAANPTYLLDANVLMEAHRRYYAFDLCPGFWECLLHHHGDGEKIISIDRVRAEFTGDDEVAQWVRAAPAGLFLPTTTALVGTQFGEMMEWVNQSQQFSPEAKAEFAQVADGWLPAYAKLHGCTVVTQEQFNPEIKKKVPIPNVCRQFAVECIDTFDMLRKLEARFNWNR